MKKNAILENSLALGLLALRVSPGFSAAVLQDRQHKPPFMFSIPVFKFNIADSKFEIRVVEDSAPIEPGEALFFQAHARGKWKEVEQMGEMEGGIHIASAGEALAFVRLRTSRRTFYLMEPDVQGEVMSISSVRPWMTYGDEDYLPDPRGAAPNESNFGVLAPKTLRDSGLNDARVEYKRGRYWISRFILGPKYEDDVRHAVPVYHLLETVWPNGRYRVKSFLVTDDRVKRISWDLVYFR